MKSIILVFVCVAASLLATEYAHAGLVVRFEFEGNANDLSGSGNNGTLINGASFVADSPFGSGQSLSTANASPTENQGVEISASPSLGANPFTLAYWFKATSDQDSRSNERITGRNGDNFETAIGNASLIGGTTSSTGLTLSYYNGQWKVTNVAISVDDWTHVAWVNTASNMTLFVNGVSAFTGPTVSGGRPGVGLMRIGTRYNGLEGFEGYVDDFRLYDTGLNATDIASLASTSIPEPSTFALFGIGAIVLIIHGRRSGKGRRKAVTHM